MFSSQVVSVAKAAVPLGQQVRCMGAKHLAWHLKGKTKFSNLRSPIKLAKFNKLSVEGKAEFTKQIERSKEIRWEPTTDVERLYKPLVTQLAHSKKKINNSELFTVFEKVSSQSDMKYAVKLWRVARSQNLHLREQTTALLLQKLCQTGYEEGALELIKNSAVLHLNVDHAMLKDFIQHCLSSERKEELAPMAADAFKALAEGKLGLKARAADYYLYIKSLVAADMPDKALEAYELQQLEKHAPVAGTLSLVAKVYADKEDKAKVAEIAAELARLYPKSESSFVAETKALNATLNAASTSEADASASADETTTTTTATEGEGESESAKQS